MREVASDASRVPDAEDVRATHALLAGRVVRTPLLRAPVLDARTGGTVLLKAETLQHTGAFKFRGAMSRLLRLTDAERARGVVAFSSGNHGQAVAAAGRRLGIAATIVMPQDAPPVKIERTRGHGAEVVLYDPATASREALAAEIAEARGATLVPSYDDRWVIAGQGTAGMELIEQARAEDLAPDALLVCCGGGGLTAGCALARDALDAPGMAIHTVEPAGHDDHARSFASGRPERNEPGTRSICDALLSPEPGALTFPVNAARVAGGLVVDDDAVRAALRFAFEHLRLVVEPGGAVALAALLQGLVPTEGRTTVVMLSGANVDPTLFASVIGATGA
jgi:threonine dehydratase